MSSLKRRLEKLEGRLEFMKAEAKEKQARLAEIERLGNDNSLAALLLKLELAHGRKYTLADVVAMTALEVNRECSQGLK
jgi:hypothetical protein